MELKTCPVCDCKPLLLSEEEVVCINYECAVNSVIIKKSIWNKRADFISRDAQIIRELEQEHSMTNNMEKIKLRYPELFD